MDQAQAIAEFRPGKHNHHRGGQYTAICIALDHETREPMVVYVSLTHGTTCVRPLCTPGEDSWTDLVDWGGRTGPRFARILDAEQPR
jgi:hypothetical protein